MGNAGLGMLSETRATFYVIDDEPLAARTIARALGRFGHVLIAGSLAEATELLARARPTAQILDVAMPDGDGLTWLEALWRAGTDPTTLVVTGLRDDVLETRAICAGSTLVHKPFGRAAVVFFARYAVTAEHLPVGLARTLVARTASLHDFTTQQTRLLALAVAAIDRKERPARLGVTLNTYKKVVRQMLSVTGGNTIEELVQPIVHRILSGLAIE